MKLLWAYTLDFTLRRTAVLEMQFTVFPLDFQLTCFRASLHVCLAHWSAQRWWCDGTDRARVLSARVGVCGRCGRGQCSGHPAGGCLLVSVLPSFMLLLREMLLLPRDLLLPSTPWVLQTHLSTWASRIFYILVLHMNRVLTSDSFK